MMYRRSVRLCLGKLGFDLVVCSPAGGGCGDLHSIGWIVAVWTNGSRDHLNRIYFKIHLDVNI